MCFPSQSGLAGRECVSRLGTARQADDLSNAPPYAAGGANQSEETGNR